MDAPRGSRGSGARLDDGAYRRVLESTPGPLYVWRLSDGQVLFFTPALAELLRLREGDGPDNVSDFEIDTAERAAFLDELRAGGSAAHHRMRFRQAGGETFTGELSGRLVEVEGEDCAVCTLMDLTAQLQREAELKQAREILEDAIEALDDGFVLYDSSDRLIICNSRYKSFHGDSADLLVPGAHWPDVTRIRAERGFFTDAEGRLEEWLAGQIAQRGIAKREEFASKDGRWFEYSHRQTRQGGFVSVWDEITARKMMEHALRRSEEYFRSMVEGHPLPVWMVDIETSEILYESPAAAEMFGREWPSTVTLRSTEHFADPQVRAQLIARLRETGSLQDVEVELRRMDGSSFWASLNDRLISYGGRDVSVVGFVDLTARREAEAEAARQRDLMHQGEKLSALGELLAGVAHELNNPLSVLVGHALMLKETATDPATAKRADVIGSAANRCARIVRTFLAMAREESGEMLPVDVNALVMRALDFASYSLKTSGIDVVLELDEGLPEITGNADQLVQVFTNLLVNAEHALNEVDRPRRLEIVTRPVSNRRQVAVTFRDNGTGVPEAVRSRIFEPLYTTKRPGSGTGLGLALSHRIVTAHGGSIELEDAPGPGATFTVRLICDTAPGDGQVPGDAGERSREPALRVLVIDDEPDVGMLIGESLELEGHIVEVTASARRALELIEETAFDVVISDIRMPDMDGPAFYRALEAGGPERVAGLAFVTGDTLNSRVGDFLARTGCPYLEKPFVPADVRDLIVQVMRRRQPA
ncbi:ATP-binding protein [Microbaculum marinum]|uniref:histidine kinase n=1 Tax=Microbaculum marinum TaxID=1764581 RepID=A0AAW9RW84_9HYPH